MSCPEFIAQSMAVRTAAHLMHLTTQSYAQHMALGDFYEALMDLIDTYAESYQGTNAPIKAFPDTPVPKGTPIGVLEAYLAVVMKEQEEDHDDEGLENILAEIQTLVSQTLYKLKRLK